MGSPFENSLVRQSTLWTPFLNYGFYNLIQQDERMVIFGLYSRCYANDDAYLQGISDISMEQILSDFNTKMAELDVDEQKTVMGIATKRYLAEIDTLVHDRKMETELQKINASSSEWDAKTAALEVDRAALVTLQVHVATEINKINAKIEEIQAYIQLEAANLAMVDIEIAGKQLALAEKDMELATKSIEESKRDIAILQVANDIAKIQIQIVDAGLELVDIDMKVARTKVDIAQTENQISKLGLAASELVVEKARTEAEQNDLATYDTKILLAQAQTIEVNKEISATNIYAANEAAIGQARIDESEAQLADHLQSIELSAERTVFNIKDRDITAALEKDIGAKSNAAQAIMDIDKINTQDAHSIAASISVDAAVEAATTLATATIGSELTHLIKKAA